jgi:hypothetical protein
VRFASVGTDDPASPQALRRIFQFHSDGPGQVMAAVSAATGGKVEICIFRGSPEAPLTTPFCRQMQSSALRATVSRDADWTVTVIGANVTTTPIIDLSLTFRADHPFVHVRNFRFQGTSVPPYNGFVAIVQARGAGAFDFVASWTETGGSGVHDYDLNVSDQTDSHPPYDAAGTGTTMTGATGLVADHAYRVQFRNTAELVATQVFLDARFSWP